MRAMRRTLAALALAATAACSGPHQGGAPAQRPRAANSLRFDLAADPANLNPLFLHQDAASVEQQVARLAFLPFLDLDSRGRFIPELVTRVPTVANGDVSADGRTIIYHLRPNVRWSDGLPVTANDVLWTLHAIMDPNTPVPSREGYDLIDRAYAKSPHTVVFHLRHAWAPAATTFFSYGFRPQFVLPSHVLSKQIPLAQAPFNAAPTVGDGPFTFVSWKRGESLLYRANTRYWRGTPHVQRLDIRVIPDPQTNLVMLRSGQLDWNLIAPVQQETLYGARGVRYAYVSTAVVAGLVFNLSHPPLDDARVRRAIAMGIDRQGISKKITLGRYPVTNAIQPQFSWAYDPAVKEPGYDPARSDALLDAAGWRRSPSGMREKNAKTLALVYVQFPESMTGVRVATAVQAQLRDRGIAVEIKSVSNAQTLSAFLARRHARRGAIRHGVRSLHDGIGSRRFVDPRVQCALELHALLQRAGRRVGEGGASRRFHERPQTDLRPDRTPGRARLADPVFVQRRLHLCVPRATARVRTERISADVECSAMVNRLIARWVRPRKSLACASSASVSKVRQRPNFR